MTTSENSRESELRNIMNDDDYVALFEAEYELQKRPIDEVGKRQIWNNVLARINADEKTHTFNNIVFRKWMPTAAVALLIFTVIPLYFFLQSEDSASRMKGLEGTPIVRLSAFSIGNTGQLSASTGELESGNTIVFKYDVSKPVALALLMSRNTKQPEIRYINNSAQPGTGVLLQKNNKTYGYMLEPLDKHVRFCLISAENGSALKKRLNTIGQEWANLAAETCVSINIKLSEFNEH